MSNNIKPILFSTPMVQAILSGRKTHTRRLIKSRHKSGLFEVCRRKVDGQITEITSLDWDERMVDPSNDIRPKYLPEDILWVRETWQHSDYGGYEYRANFDDNCPVCICWKPSIYMPKSAARIFLEVTNVRVERLQDISKEDAIKEGAMKVWEDGHGNFYHPESETVKMIGDYGDYKTGFKAIWKSINGIDSWDQNPWVWVYEFKKIDKQVNFIP